MIVRWVLGNQDGLLYVLSRLADRRYWRCLLLFCVFMSLPRYADTRYAVEAPEGWLLVLHMRLSTILSEARLHHSVTNKHDARPWGPGTSTMGNLGSSASAAFILQILTGRIHTDAFELMSTNSSADRTGVCSVARLSSKRCWRSGFFL